MICWTRSPGGPLGSAMTRSGNSSGPSWCRRRTGCAPRGIPSGIRAWPRSGLVSAARRGEAETSLPLEAILERLAETGLGRIGYARSRAGPVGACVGRHAARTGVAGGSGAEVRAAGGVVYVHGVELDAGLRRARGAPGGRSGGAGECARDADGARTAAVSEPDHGIVRHAAAAPGALPGDGGGIAGGDLRQPQLWKLRLELARHAYR